MVGGYSFLRVWRGLFFVAMRVAIVVQIIEVMVIVMVRVRMAFIGGVVLLS